MFELEKTYKLISFFDIKKFLDQNGIVKQEQKQIEQKELHISDDGFPLMETDSNLRKQSKEEQEIEI
jgi:hypothetical protein